MAGIQSGAFQECIPKRELGNEKKFGRQYTFPQTANQKQVLDIVLSGAAVALDVTGITEHDVCMVVAWSGDLALPGFKQVTMNEIEACMRLNPEVYSGLHRMRSRPWMQIPSLLRYWQSIPQKSEAKTKY